MTDLVGHSITHGVRTAASWRVFRGTLLGYAATEGGMLYSYHAPRHPHLPQRVAGNFAGLAIAGVALTYWGVIAPPGDRRPRAS